jgi:hypothetical protein
MKILNPKTGRYVKTDGILGKKLLYKHKLLQNLKEYSNNDIDPISLDNFNDLEISDLQNLIAIGNDIKKNYYILENIYQVYKIAILSNKHPKDPMNMQYELTDNEINDINLKMRIKDSNYSPPVYIAPKTYDFELQIELSMTYVNFFSIKIIKNNRVKYDLGLIPGWIESHHTGSTDYTSGVLLSNLHELWEKHLFFDDLNKPIIDLRKSYSYWQGPFWRQKFINLCTLVTDALVI